MNVQHNTESRYPHVAGHALGSDTSREAAESINDFLPACQRSVLGALADGVTLTGDEIAERIGWERWAVRPRLAELKRLGKIRDTGARRVNRASGRRAAVWEAING